MTTKTQVYDQLKYLIKLTDQNYQLRTVKAGKRTLYAIYFYSTSNCWFNLSERYGSLEEIYNVLKTMNEYIYAAQKHNIKPLGKSFINNGTIGVNFSNEDRQEIGLRGPQN